MLNRRQLALALAIGLVAQAILLAFGLHASLWLASISTGPVYWILNGIYLVIALAVCLAAFRWGNLRVRLLVAAVVLAAGVIIGWGAVPNPSSV